MKIAISSFLLTLAIAFAAPAFAQSEITTDVTRAELISDVTAIAPGKPFHLAIALSMQPRWHTYWKNPGDAGLPFRVEWRLPEGFTAGELLWPPPARFETAGIVNYGYENDALFTAAVTMPDRVPVGTDVTFTAKANWMVCKDICIPESAELSLTLPVVDEPVPSQHAKKIDAVITTQPSTALPALWRVTDSKVTLDITLPAALALLQNAEFFPSVNGAIANSLTQHYTLENNHAVFSLPAGNAPAQASAGLLALHTENGVHYFTVDPKTGAGLSSFPTEKPANEAALWYILLLAFLGGMILNLMPCVLPVLSLKALSVARKAGDSRKVAAGHGLAYTLGVMASFGGLAAVLLALQESGKAVGWGYQMQSPVFVGALTYLMFIIGLNLSGVFTLPVLFGNAGGHISRKDTMLGTFLTGVLATFVATPCTAPFMATALGYALGQPPFYSILVFESLGFGLAFPFLTISLFPKLLSWLPKPGRWMEHLKHLLAFPMYAATAWLVWVLTQQTGPDGLLAVLIGCVLVALSLWLMRFLHELHFLGHIGALMVLAVISLYPLYGLHTASARAGDAPIAFSLPALDNLRREGKPVFVNVTAAWCITCKVNERLALDTRETHDWMQARRIVRMEADWTLEDAAITHYLEGFGRKGVPLYVYYPPKGEPRVLPQLLTGAIVRDYMQ